MIKKEKILEWIETERERCKRQATNKHGSSWRKAEGGLELLDALHQKIYAREFE